MGFSFSKCSCISASHAAWIHGISYLAFCGGKSPVGIHLLRHLQPWPQRVPHPQTSVCTAWSTRSPARNGWPDTRGLRLPSVCCPQPGTPPATNVCNACVTRGWACTVCSTRSNCSHFGTRKQRLLRVWYPQPLPAICMPPAANACTVWPACSSCLQRVQNTRNHWFAMRDTRAWSATCLRHQPWWGCIASGLFGEACSALACKSAKLNGLRDRRRPPYVSGTNPGEAAMLLDISTRLAVHLHAKVPNSMGCVTIVGLHMWTYVMTAAGPDQPPSLKLTFGLAPSHSSGVLIWE